MSSTGPRVVRQSPPRRRRPLGMALECLTAADMAYQSAPAG